MTQLFSNILLGVFALAGIIYLAFVGYQLITNWNGAKAKAIRDNGPSTLGLPFAGLASFALVVNLQAATSGELQFKGLSMDLKGPSSQLMFWILCFLTIVAAIRLVMPKA